MPLVLRKACSNLDAAVDRLYRPQPFADNWERAEHLLMRYEMLSAPLSAAAQQNPKRRKG